MTTNKAKAAEAAKMKKPPIVAAIMKIARNKDCNGFCPFLERLLGNGNVFVIIFYMSGLMGRSSRALR